MMSFIFGRSTRTAELRRIGTSTTRRPSWPRGVADRPRSNPRVGPPMRAARQALRALDALRRGQAFEFFDRGLDDRGLGEGAAERFGRLETIAGDRHNDGALGRDLSLFEQLDRAGERNAARRLGENPFGLGEQADRLYDRFIAYGRGMATARPNGARRIDA